MVDNRQERLPAAATWDVLAMITLGGAVGALARYGLGLVAPTRPANFPWTTLIINSLGCLFIGVLAVLLAQVWTAQRLVRPFVGVGILGGFTTYSTYAVDAARLLDDGRLATAVLYLVGTLVAALAAVWLGQTVTRRACSGWTASRRGARVNTGTSSRAAATSSADAAP